MNSERPTFEIGIVMAGAISAGAYTAGVIDFLLQALEAWDAAKSDPTSSVPRHQVLIRVLSGASAGAMASAITAVSFASETSPVTDIGDPPDPVRNRLFDAWVRQIDISKLLGISDIEKSGIVSSLLDASVLEKIASDALVTNRRTAPRSYVYDPLAVFLTVANLRGIPYGFHLFGSSEDTVYGMYEHMDHIRFSVSEDRNPLPDARILDPAEAPGGHWPALAMGALASGAFPGGLAPRLLERPWTDYDNRHRRRPIWGDSHKDPYRFLCVDGGLMDNEPLELARQFLSGGQNLRNPRDGLKANRAVILVDPFPNRAQFDEAFEPDGRLTSVAMQMFSALKNQARFKPEELNLAEDRTVYSRFMISPSRQDTDGNPVEPAMASGILGGFGGFFHQSFREHDFQLGRRNCQAFLRWHFRLPATNALFSNIDPSVASSFYARGYDGTLEQFDMPDGSRVPFLPIIPLVDDMTDPVPRPPWPKGCAVDVDRLEWMINRRARHIGIAFARSELKPLLGAIGRWIAEKVWSWYLARRVTKTVMAVIRKELARLP